MLQQDLAALGAPLHKIENSYMIRNDLALYKHTVLIKGREEDQSSPQPNLPEVMPKVSRGAEESSPAAVQPTRLLSSSFWNILRPSLYR